MSIRLYATAHRCLIPSIVRSKSTQRCGQHFVTSLPTPSAAPPTSSPSSKSAPSPRAKRYRPRTLIRACTSGRPIGICSTCLLHGAAAGLSRLSRPLPHTALARPPVGHVQSALLERLTQALRRAITLDLVDVRYVATCSRGSTAAAATNCRCWCRATWCSTHSSSSLGSAPAWPAAASRPRGVLSRACSPAFAASVTRVAGAESFDAVKLDAKRADRWSRTRCVCLRDAVAAATYAQSGAFSYRKDDVLAFLQAQVPTQAAVLQNSTDGKRTRRSGRRWWRSFAAIPRRCMRSSRRRWHP